MHATSHTCIHAVEQLLFTLTTTLNIQPRIPWEIRLENMHKFKGRKTNKKLLSQTQKQKKIYYGGERQKWIHAARGKEVKSANAALCIHTFALGALILYMLQYALLFICGDIDVSHELAGCVCKRENERDRHTHTQIEEMKLEVYKLKWRWQDAWKGKAGLRLQEGKTTSREEWRRKHVVIVIHIGEIERKWSTGRL